MKDFVHFADNGVRGFLEERSEGSGSAGAFLELSAEPAESNDRSDAKRSREGSWDIDALWRAEVFGLG